MNKFFKKNAEAELANGEPCLRKAFRDGKDILEEAVELGKMRPAEIVGQAHDWVIVIVAGVFNEGRARGVTVDEAKKKAHEIIQKHVVGSTIEQMAEFFQDGMEKVGLGKRVLRKRQPGREN